jgi:hypothetical protein
VTVLQTIGVYVLIPLALYGVLSLFTLWPRISRGPRYRPGQEWPHEPVWWTGNPEGIGTGPLPVGSGRPVSITRAVPRSTARGGARGNW